MFVWGALAERAAAHRERVANGVLSNPSTSSTSVVSSTSSAHAADGDVHGEGKVEGGASQTSVGGDVHGAGGVELPGSHTAASSEHRTVFGIDLESSWVIADGAIISLVLAMLLAIRTEHWVLVATVIACLGFVALEIAEVQHQHSEGRSGLVLLAVLAGLAHLAAAIAGGSASIARAT